MTSLKLAGVAATAIALVSLANSAIADDMQGSDMNSSYQWTGFYTGVYAGYGFGNDDDVVTTGQAPGNVANVAGGARPGSVGLSPEGFVGGALMGFNWVSGRWVYGTEADISYTDMDEQRTVRTTGLNGVDQLNNTFSQELEYLGTLRGRIGYSFDGTLPYITGGFAYGSIDNSVNLFGPAGQLQFTGNDSGTETGYVVGAGVEHAFLTCWRFRVEYLYYDLGDNTVNVAVIPGSGGGGTGYNSTFDNNGHIVRAGLVYAY